MSILSSPSKDEGMNHTYFILNLGFCFFFFIIIMLQLVIAIHFMELMNDNILGLPTEEWTDYIKFEDLEMEGSKELGSGAFGTVYKGVYLVS